MWINGNEIKISEVLMNLLPVPPSSDDLSIFWIFITITIILISQCLLLMTMCTLLYPTVLYHRIIEKFWLKGTTRGHQLFLCVHLPYHGILYHCHKWRSIQAWVCSVCNQEIWMEDIFIACIPREEIYIIL